jgi:hypothetical protein
MQALEGNVRYLFPAWQTLHGGVAQGGVNAAKSFEVLQFAKGLYVARENNSQTGTAEVPWPARCTT